MRSKGAPAETGGAGGGTAGGAGGGSKAGVRTASRSASSASTCTACFRRRSFDLHGVRQVATGRFRHRARHRFPAAPPGSRRAQAMSPPRRRKKEGEGRSKREVRRLRLLQQPRQPAAQHRPRRRDRQWPLRRHYPCAARCRTAKPFRCAAISAGRARRAVTSFLAGAARRAAIRRC